MSSMTIDGPRTTAPRPIVERTVADPTPTTNDGPHRLATLTA
jgi:hypothetical protein